MSKSTPEKVEIGSFIDVYARTMRGNMDEYGRIPSHCKEKLLQEWEPVNESIVYLCKQRVERKK